MRTFWYVSASRLHRKREERFEMLRPLRLNGVVASKSTPTSRVWHFGVSKLFRVNALLLKTVSTTDVLVHAGRKRNELRPLSFGYLNHRRMNPSQLDCVSFVQTHQTVSHKLTPPHPSGRMRPFLTAQLQSFSSRLQFISPAFIKDWNDSVQGPVRIYWAHQSHPHHGHNSFIFTLVHLHLWSPCAETGTTNHPPTPPT